MTPRARAGATDPEAPAERGRWIAAFDSEFDHVYRSLRRHGVTAADAEDLAQDVFLVMWRRRAQFDPGRSLRAWLGGIAFRVAYEHRRRKGREVPSGFVDAPDPAIHAEEHLASTSARVLVRACLAAMNPKYRALIVMHELDGVSMQTIAAELGVPLATAYTRLRTARLSFAKMVRRLRTQVAFGGSDTLTTETLLEAERAAPPPPAEARRRVMTRVRRVVLTPQLEAPPPVPRPLAKGPLLALAGLVLVAAGVALVRWRAPAFADQARPTRAADRASTLEVGLAGYWRFDDGPGSRIARDHSSTRADCQMRRNADPQGDWVAGRHGGALSMRARGWLECPPAAFRSAISSEMTVATWVKRNPEQGSLRALVTRQFGEGSQDDFFLGFREGDVIVSSHRWQGQLRQSLPEGDGWLHVAATFDRAGTTRLYLNGREVTRVPGQPANVAGGDKPVVIGGSFNGFDQANQRFQGAIDDLLLYQRALAPAEVAALAAGAQPPI